MTRTPRWTAEPVVDGVGTYRLSSWRWFSDYISQRMLDYRYVFRGHASDRWKLNTTLDRALMKLHKDRRTGAPERHLENFKMATRGRRGASSTVPSSSDDDWWSLGQHHGLHTPLLDWTESPFVALYFAFADVDTEDSDYRAVWALHEDVAMLFNQEAYKPTNEARLGGLYRQDVRMVRPFSDDNARLVSQRGLFMRVPSSHTVEDVVSAVFPGEDKSMWLLKIRIPNKRRTECLSVLNRMNINHLSLFPDLYGSAVHCNTDLHIKGY